MADDPAERIPPGQSGQLTNHAKNGTFRALLCWPDIDDPRRSDDFGVTLKLGPDGHPPVEIRDVQLHAGRKYIDTYVLEPDMIFLPNAVYYRHKRSEIIDQ